MKIERVSEHIYDVESFTEKGKRYSVIVTDRKESCTCADFTFRGSECKHIQGVKTLKSKDKIEYPQGG